VAAPSDSYEGTIQGIENVLRAKTPHTRPETLIEGWRRDYSTRLAPGAADNPEHVAKGYEYRIERFLEWCAAVGLHPLHAGYAEMRAYRDYLRDSPVMILGAGGVLRDAPNLKLRTVVTHLVALTHFYDYIVDVLGLKLRNPARPMLSETKDLLDHQPVRSRRRAPTVPEFQSILRHTPGLREIAGFTVDALTSARSTEFRWIKDADFYIDERWLRLTPLPKGKRVRPSWDRRDAPKPIDNSFWVPLTKEAAWVAEQWIEAKQDYREYRRSPFFYPPQERKDRALDKPISDTALNEAYKDCVRRADDVKVDWEDPADALVFHGLRHLTTDALENATRGEDGEARYKDMIDLLRGDSDLSKRSANTYKHIKPHDLQAFVDEFSPTYGAREILTGFRLKQKRAQTMSDLILGSTKGPARRVA
jgi:hypothetical protein